GVGWELELVVGGQARVGTGGVGQGPAEEVEVAEVIAEGCLARLQNLGIVVRCEFLLHDPIVPEAGWNVTTLALPQTVVNATLPQLEAVLGNEPLAKTSESGQDEAEVPGQPFLGRNSRCHGTATSISRGPC